MHKSFLALLAFHVLPVLLCAVFCLVKKFVLMFDKTLTSNIRNFGFSSSFILFIEMCLMLCFYGFI